MEGTRHADTPFPFQGDAALEVVPSYLAVDFAVCWSLFVGIVLDQGRPKIPANIRII